MTNQDSERERISYEIEGLHISEATDYILDLNKQTRNAALQEALEATKTISDSLKSKPDHGPCCTCQGCGQHYDYCNCDELRGVRKTVEAIKKLMEE